MLTIENLKLAGANTEDGVRRCAGNEAFYLRIAEMVIKNDAFDKLKTAIDEKDLKSGFEQAHALKGMVGNVSFDNLSAPIVDITEHLRAGEDMDYTELLTEIFNVLERYKELLK